MYRAAPCRHCGQSRSAGRMKRGLCRRCQGTEKDQRVRSPAVRLSYPHDPAGPLKRLGTQDPRTRDKVGPVPPPEPRPDVRPGPDKLPLLAERAAQGVGLFPPPDPRHGPAEPCLDLRERALPYGARYPRVWRVLAALCPAVVEFLSPGG